MIHHHGLKVNNEDHKYIIHDLTTKIRRMVLSSAILILDIL